jgi:hypothetical protein
MERNGQSAKDRLTVLFYVDEEDAWCLVFVSYVFYITWL